MRYITITDTIGGTEVTVPHDRQALLEATLTLFPDADAATIEAVEGFASDLASHGAGRNNPCAVSTPVARTDHSVTLALTWEWAPLPLLDLRGIADKLGVSYATIRRYRSQDDTFPEPDAVLAQSPGWLPETVEAWCTARPGRGVGGGRPRGPAKG